MVKILSNGDIVPDDDPRASRYSSTARPNTAQPRQRQGFIRQDDNAQQQGAAGGQQISIFDTVNQKLLGMGIPKFNVGPYTVEPVVLLGFVLAGLVFGPQGLIFAAILFMVSKWSQGGGGFGNMFGGQEGAARGGGHRLGR